MIKIKEHLRVQGYGRKGGKKYVRIALPTQISEDCDIRPRDLVKITIVEHIKVGGKK